VSPAQKRIPAKHLGAPIEPGVKLARDLPKSTEVRIAAAAPSQRGSRVKHACFYCRDRNPKNRCGFLQRTFLQRMNLECFPKTWPQLRDSISQGCFCSLVVQISSGFGEKSDTSCSVESSLVSTDRPIGTSRDA
jgi:hypothetical protein